MALTQRQLVHETTTTTGTGAYALAGAYAEAGSPIGTYTYRTFNAAVGVGNTCYYMVRDATTGFEHGIGTLSGATTLTRDAIYESSNAGAAVNWGAGTKDVYIVNPSSGYMLGANNLSEIASAATARVNLGIYPASQTGGTSTKVVRYSAANTWTDAANTDTIDQLVGLMLVVSGVYYVPGSLVTGLSGLTAGSVYYLSTAGGITTTAPTPSSTVRLVVIGKAVSTTSLLFWPGIPVGG